MIKIININKRGEIIEDISKVVIKHDDFPQIWEAVAKIAANQRMEEQKHA